MELQTFVRGDIICQQFIAHNTSSEDAGLELLLDLRLGARWNYDDIMPGFVFGKSGGYSLCLLAGKSPQELVEMSVQVFRDGKMEVIQPSFLTKPEDAQGAEQSGNTPYPLLRQHLLKHVAAGSSQELTVEYKIRKVIIESTPTIGAGPRTSLKTSEADTSVGPSMASSTDSKPHRTMSLTEMDESLEKKAKAMLADEGE